ncbi:MAG: hypothetical protein J6U00_01630 [Ruminococcus sp.]|uniref:hypothetical protein n=1 Tax=Ruminococcus sp. TaxID=41978 RepID=UPI001B014C66|nr:hypothetical protein [Ruminococcus sp.]MBO7472699.1 hypothetical protein [Ruminococcus sp.]
MLKRELEILLNDANLAIKDLEQENTNLKSRNEALTKFIAATALNITGEVEPVKKAVADIRAALTGGTEGDTAILDTIRNIISRLELRND